MIMGSGVITLTTDFGISDAYVGAIKGVILGINPNITIVDISHEIEPRNISQAAYILSSACPYFPDGTIHVAVVDPGVGSDRKAVILRTARASFVAPDNGILSYVAEDKVEIVNLTNRNFWLNPISNTFHGRDIFAPVAAHLSLGIPSGDFGEAISSLVELPQSRPEVMANGAIIGRVIHIDRFGNLITNVKQSDLPADGIIIEVKGYSINGLNASYADGGERLALIGSDGNLEIGVRNGNAADLLKIECGDVVKIDSTSLNT